MAYRINPDRPPVAEVVRAMQDQLQEAVELLAAPAPMSQDIHAVRRHCKKARGAMRLIRLHPPASLKPQHRAIRDAARLLSANRDAYVMQQTLALHCADVPGFDAARSSLDDAPEPGDLPDHVRLNAAARLGAVMQAMLAQPYDDSEKSIRRGWKRVTRKARLAYEHAEANPTAEALHDLRKRIKDVWYAAKLLRDVAPRPMRETIQAAKEASQMLGDHHDLAVLDAALARAEQADALTEVRQRLQSKLAPLEAKLLVKVKRLLRRAVKPSALFP